MRPAVTNIHTLHQPQREGALRRLQSEGFGRRVYSVQTTYADGDVLTCADPLTTDQRLGHLVRQMFALAFRSQPTDVWHRDGFMAQAWDAMGNSVELHQLNYR